MTTIETGSNHCFGIGDTIKLTAPRHGILAKIIAYFVGVYFYNKLPRPLGRFVSLECSTHKVSAVNETTFEIANDHQG